MLNSLLSFWEKHPALHVGILSLLGAASALAWHPIYLVAILSVTLPYLYKRSFSCPLLCALAAFALAYSNALWRTVSCRSFTDTVIGEGIFHIDDLSLFSSPFHRSYCYKGVFKQFRSEDGTVYYNLPCTLFHPLKDPPVANTDYVIEGTLVQKKPYLFCLKPKKRKPWKPLRNTFSFAQWRFHAKKKVAASIKERMANPESGAFLSALVTGNLEERSIRLDFNRLGLQHLLAISGFHFSFFALVLNLLLRPFFSFRMRHLALIASLGCYFFFLGNAPSIQRAFTAISIFLVAQLIKRKTSGLNALGAALCLEVAIDPLAIVQLSFQLSFLCTIALLLFYPVMHNLLCFLLPERSRSDLNEMSWIDQHGYLASSLIRKSLSLNLAVSLVMLPILLHLFHKFPLCSLLYNLFFPVCVSVSLVLLCSAYLTGISMLYHLNSAWTSFLLQLSSHPPTYFEVVLRSKAVSFSTAILCLLLFFYSGVYFWSRQRRLSR